MILCFSGTGNSRYVARELGEILGEEVMDMTPALRGATLGAGTTGDELLWVFPVYSWGVPPYVREIIRSLNVGGSPLMHAVMTCGDDCGRADRMWRADVEARGWRHGVVATVQMPNNYVAMKGFDVDSKAVEKAKLAAAPARIRHIVSLLAESRRPEGEKRLTDVVSGAFAGFKTRVIYPWFVRRKMSPERFSVSDACIGCGKCSSVCPTGNIAMHRASDASGDDRPAWGSDCAGCLGCYHICPVHAIAYGKATRDKGQYYFNR